MTPKSSRPVLYFGRGDKRLRQGLQDLGKDLGVSIFQVRRAMRRAVAAQKAYSSISVSPGPGDPRLPAARTAAS